MAPPPIPLTCDVLLTVFLLPRRLFFLVLFRELLLALDFCDVCSRRFSCL